MKLLILIVAYNHEAKIESVLSRIPDSLMEYETEVLILDDQSQDMTFEKSAAFPGGTDFPFKLTVLYNPVNQGYGGNQKIGYHYAIENGFDVVALVHGDGQYAPECLPELLQPLLKGEAEAVFGSRMLTKRGALDGGMPLYKFVGNKILTFFQNRVLGAELSEFHSGYRLYSVPALNKVPFELNTNDFHFDTEIIIQFFRAKHRIVELPIPTYYGDEICNVDGIKYAWDVFKATTTAGCQNLGIFYNRKYDIPDADDGESPYQAKLGFDSSHTFAIDAVRDGTRVLDIGSAGNYIGAKLKEKGCYVASLDQNEINTDNVDDFYKVDIDLEPLPVDVGDYDHVLMLDVIEHLSDPDAFVERLYENAGRAPNLDIVITTGNVAFGIVRFMLLLGWFNYGKKGILDRTHKRLFTFSSLRRLFEARGFEVVECKGIPAPFPLALSSRWHAKSWVRVNSWLIRISRGLFSYQIFMRLKPRPSLPWLLERANERRSDFHGPENAA